MKEKLTLSIDKEVISKSKSYAWQNNKSISSLVEEYLDKLTYSETDWKPRKSSVVEQLSGSANWPYGDEKTYKDVIREERLKKYGVQKSSD